MKIIDNKKDYYDYVSGIYGIDEYVVYDRRGSIASSVIKEQCPEIFDKNIIESDQKSYTRYGRHATNLPFLEKNYEIIIEAGEKHFFIRCMRYRKTESSPIELTYKISDYMEELRTRYNLDFYGKNSYMYNRYLSELERYSRKRSSAPLALIITDYQNYWDKEKGRREFQNPILKDLPITGLIPAEEIWQGIYDYLLKMKEPVINIISIEIIFHMVKFIIR